MDLITKYFKAGCNRFYFVDNTFNLPSGYAKKLCRLLVDADLPVSWRCIVYPWKLDKELVNLMAEAGCREIALGFESGSQEILRNLNKKFQPGDVRKTSELLSRFKIQMLGFLLLGGPGETRKTVSESLEFADSLPLEAVKITMGIRIYPHTKLAQIAVRDKIIAPDDNLLFPKFYMEPGLEPWIRKTVQAWVEDRSGWFT